MPLSGADYQQRSTDDILSFLTAEMRAEFGEDIDLTQSSAFRTFAEAVANADADQIEPALSAVHDSAFLDSAEGENLENVVSILGITRRSAVHATGVVEFRHGATASGEYTIGNGTIVQTDTTDPVRFETTELVTISPFDDFESGALASTYAGTTSDYSVVDGSASGDPSPTSGSYILEGPSTSGSKIFDDSTVVERGSEMDFRCYLPSDTIVGNCFGVVDSSNYYRVKVDTDSDEHAIEIVTSSGETALQSNSSPSIPNDDWIRNEVVWDGEDNGRIVSRLYDSNDSLVDEISVTDEAEIDDGGFGFESLDSNDNKYWDHSGERAVQADARCTEGGTVGNIGPNTLTVLPTVPTGVNSVTNPWAMGDDDHNLTNTIEFSTGRPEETDGELRDRAQVSEGARGDGTIPAMIAAVSSLPEAESVSVYENDSDADNTGGGGLPPMSFEVVYFGSDPNQNIADTIFDTKGFTARDYGGAHGTGISETVQASNGQIFTVEWTEPNELAVDMTLDIVVNDEFIGEDELRDRVVEYVGGVLSGGSDTIGTGTGEDVYIDQIEDVVTGPTDTGVIGISSYSFTPSTTTNSNGLEVVDVGANEVATTNAQDGSINLTITRV